MREGVTIVDPQTTWMGVRVTIEPDAVIHQNTQLHGATHIEAHAEVGPDCTLRDTKVGRGAKVVKSHCQSAEIGADSDVGPFSFLRPGTRLGRGAKVGAFVETKNAEIGDDSKIPHLSYVGDAEIGERSNIGAATVFVNYDGVDKHRTVDRRRCQGRLGHDARRPRDVGDGAYTAAGSVISEDVPPGALGIARGTQRNVEGWVEKRRPDSPAAKAAATGANRRQWTGLPRSTATKRRPSDRHENPGREDAPALLGPRPPRTRRRGRRERRDRGQPDPDPGVRERRDLRPVRKSPSAAATPSSFSPTALRSTNGSWRR